MVIDISKGPQRDTRRKESVIITSRSHALNDEPTYIRPEKCKRCVWGEWTGTKQWCSKKDCVKDGEEHEAKNS